MLSYPIWYNNVYNNKTLIIFMIEKYDVVLACAFEPEEIFYSHRDLIDVLIFYDNIGEIIQKIGKRPYLPHKEIDLGWDPSQMFSIPNEIVIPSADLVIGYLGINSTAAGIMIGSAQMFGIPLIYLDHDNSNLEKDIGFKGLDYNLIEFSSEDDLLSKLELSLRKFYQQ